MNEFEKCTICKHDEDRYIIECKKGLWAVEGPYMKQIINEAMHYFNQYKADGEYSEILGSKSGAELLSEQT